MNTSAHYFDREDAERRVGREVRNTSMSWVFGVPTGTRGQVVRAEAANSGCWQVVVAWETRYRSDRETDLVNRFGYEHYLTELTSVGDCAAPSEVSK